MGCLKIRPDCGRPDGKKRQRPAPLFGAGILFARLSRMTALERLKTCPFMLCGLQIDSAAEACSFPLANRISINTTETSFRGFATRILIKEARNEFPRICNSHIKQRRSERYPSHLQPAYETKATTGTSFQPLSPAVGAKDPSGRRTFSENGWHDGSRIV
ncbi:MAG: hypothetical protein CW346_02095 [Bacillaceae bacterium]|nr:hypothetical protein [Bacillaceae bacterium]